MTAPLITLGIPIYNASNLIERTLLSVLNQTYPNIEYLFIDDKGDSMDIVRHVVQNHSRRESVQIIDQGHNQGIAVARNTIIDYATGQYLFTMDCDDVITPDCIELLHKRMQEHPVDFVAASFVRCDMAGKEYSGCQYEDTLIEGGEYPVARYRYGYGKKLFVATWNKLYQLDFLRKHNIRCQPGHFNEDPWFTYQVIMCACSCHLLPNCTLRYTYNPNSVSGISAFKGYSEKIAYQFLEIQQLKCAYIRSFTSQSFYCNLLTDVMGMSLYHAYRIETSPQLSVSLKKELQQSLLSCLCASPLPGKGGKRTLKYGLLCSFFFLPIGIKLFLVRVAGKLLLKERLRAWIHFKE